MAPKDPSMEFILYRLEAMEKRMDAMEKSSSAELINILLKLLEKQPTAPQVQVQSTKAPEPAPVPAPACENNNEIYDTLLSFARRRTIV
jgi:hypothetical protein